MTAHGAAAAMAVLVGTLMNAQKPRELALSDSEADPGTRSHRDADRPADHNVVTQAEVWVAQQPRHDDTTYHDTEDEARATGAALIWRMS